MESGSLAANGSPRPAARVTSSPPSIAWALHAKLGREIDEVLYQHPSVAAAATIGVPDPLYGEEVAAFIVMKDGMKASEEELISHCQAELADYKCPKSIRIVAEIPKGPTGKLLKRELARIYAIK